VDVDVAAHVRREAGGVLVADGVAVGSEPVQGGVEVEGVPQRIWGSRPRYQCLPR